MNQRDVIYNEYKNSWFLMGTIIFMGIISILTLTGEIIYKWNENGYNTPPIWLCGLLVLFFLLFFWGFRRIQILISSEEIIIGFNRLFAHRIKFSEIERIEPDDHVYTYLGSGIRIRFIHQKFRIVYNAGPPRVVINIKNKRKQIVFSTNHPEKVIKTVAKYIRG